MYKFANMQDTADACGLVSELMITGKLDGTIATVAEKPAELAGFFPRTCKALADEGVAQVLEDAQVAYARLFCNAAVRGWHPYESVYRGKNHLLMQEPRDAVLAVYHARGFAPDEGLHLPEDHLGFELAFVQKLVTEGDEDAARAFIDGHVAAWLPFACNDLESLTDDPFWLDVSDLLRAVVAA